MKTRQYLYKVIAHNLIVFLCMCLLEINKLYWPIEKWLFIKRGKGDSLKYHISKMNFDNFSERNALFLITERLLTLVKLSPQHSQWMLMMFHSAQFAVYTIDRVDLEWLEIIENISTGEDYVAVATSSDLISERQIQQALGENEFKQFISLSSMDALAFIQNICKERGITAQLKEGPLNV